MKFTNKNKEQIIGRIKRVGEKLKKDFILLSEQHGYLKYSDIYHLEEFKHGIYLLYYKDALQYIGTATGPNTFVYKRLRSCVYGSHTFFVKWKNKHKSKAVEKVREDLKKNLRIRIILCNSFQEQVKLEHFAIGIFTPPFNDKIEE